MAVSRWGRLAAGGVAVAVVAAGLTVGAGAAGASTGRKVAYYRASKSGYVSGPGHLAPGRVKIRVRGSKGQAFQLVRSRHGAGKAKLLARLAAAARLPEPRLLELPQDLTHDEERAAWVGLRALPNAVRGRTLQLVAALGVDPVRLLGSAHPSAGEAKKLRLAVALTRGAWVAFLDEPTNHLDLPSAQRLAAALAAWPGALVVVSHDRAFAREAKLDTVWRLHDGRVDVAELDA